MVRVKYEIEDTRVGQRTNYDKLVMEIWTNGTVTPADGRWSKGPRSCASTSTRSSSTPSRARRCRIDERADTPAVADDTVDHELERKLNMSLAELELSVRATNCLESEGITTVRDLVIRTDEELLEVRNFGETTLKEVKQQAGGARPAPGHEAADLAATLTS